MYNENQSVTVKWNTNNKEWYESIGYVFTKRYDEFVVPAKHLYRNSGSIISATCDYCGSAYTSKYYELLKRREKCNKDACSKCAGLKASDVSHKRRASEAFSKLSQICRELGYTLITREDEYTNKRMKVKYICPKHGIQEVNIDNLIHGSKCLECSYETRFDTIMIPTDKVEETILSFGDIWENRSEYINSTTRNLRIRCKCGATYVTSYQVFIRKHQTMCSKCSQKESYGERTIREFLSKNEIEFEQEKRFDDCRDKKSLPFDFYLPHKNVCIEFDGIQHYRPVRGHDSFDNLKKHDEMKNKYCDMQGIRLIRIPYTAKDNIQQVLEDEIQI